MTLSSLEKGTGFELKLAELFKQRGYHVTHNIKMKGKSGAEHQIDVLAQYQAPLHTSTVIIEAKSYQNNIDKDIVMKLIQIQQDLSADRAILATTSDFTIGALQTAQQYQNIELWDRTKVTSLLGEIALLDTSDAVRPITTNSVKIVESKLSMDEIRKYAEESAQKRSKGGLFGRNKIEENVKTIQKFLYPYFDVDMEAKIRQVEKTGWFSKEEIITTTSSRTSVDGNTGSIIHVEKDRISYDYSYLSGLSTDEISMLYYVSRVRGFEKRNLSAIGWTGTRINRVVNSLAAQGLLTQTSSRPVTYKITKPYPIDPSIFQSIMESHQVIEKTTDDKRINHTIQPASIATMFQDFWSGCNVKSIDLVYYPYYKIVYEREDGTKRHEIIDGVYGTRQEYLEKIIPTTD